MVPPTQLKNHYVFTFADLFTVQCSFVVWCFSNTRYTECKNYSINVKSSQLKSTNINLEEQIYLHIYILLQKSFQFLIILKQGRMGEILCYTVQDTIPCGPYNPYSTIDCEKRIQLKFGAASIEFNHF